MLQQTRVDTVIPYYGRWLERFPDIVALAEADEEDVLRVWQGLGYYSRARRLREGALLVRERLGGVMPGDSRGLLELPGVGDYTAGAVASIAFGEVVSAVDGNVKRVLSRLFDLPAPTPKLYGTIANALVDPQRPGDFNQAMMELGALICVPRSPRCQECPVASECLALERGTVEERPAAKEKRRIPEEERAVLVAVAGDSAKEPFFLFRKRPSTGLLAGMWEFPSVEVSAPLESPGGSGETPLSGAAFDLAAGLGLGPGTSVTGQTAELRELPPITHVFSHLKVRYRAFLLPVGSGVSVSPDSRLRWVPLEGLDRLPIPVAQRKLLESAVAALDS
jgi:A/G-specific adenine glycosylase